MTKVIGITGGIASGKSTVTNYLLDKSYPVVDCDLLTRQAYIDCFEEIKRAFSDCIIDRRIDRQKLAKRIFSCPQDKKKLESIIHPYCRQKMTEAIIAQHGGLLFLDIPLLFEAGMEDLCDEIWLVYVDEQTQLNRLMMRNGFDEAEARKRIAAQMPLKEKKDLADIILDNNGNREALISQVQKRLEASHE